MSLEQEVSNLTSATTDLLEAVNVRKETLDQKVNTATGAAATATQKATEAQGSAQAASGHATTATQKANEAAASADNAAAVVTGGTGTLTPEAGKLPIARAVGTIDPAWLDQIPSRAQFEALAQKRRNIYAGSGFVEWGKSVGGMPPGYSPINEGMFPYAISWSSTLSQQLHLGSNHTTTTGTSKTPHPLISVNGYMLRIERVALATNTNLVPISFPPAPATADLLDRQDLVFLEVWHEDISEKDFIYPFGNVQFGTTAYVPPGGTSINTVVAAGSHFAGHDTYSLFGNWQSAGALIGRGMKWSTMTAVQKRQFLSDPENNCYLDGDKIIQVRYRVRVVEGLGSAWGQPAPSKNAQSMLWYDTGNRLMPKGKTTNIVADLGTGIDYFYNPSVTVNGVFTVPGDTGVARAVVSTGALTTKAHSGLCFALPIALVHRRNQGAYHPVWNPNGTKTFWDNTGAVNAGRQWYLASAKTPSSTADCFSTGTSNTEGNNPPFVHTDGLFGRIGGTSGRPDGLFFDEINERDVRDLRNSAHRVTDLKRTLEREFNKLVAGTTRGWERALGGWNLAFTHVTTSGGHTVLSNGNVVGHTPIGLAGGIIVHNNMFYQVYQHVNDFWIRVRKLVGGVWVEGNHSDDFTVPLSVRYFPAFPGLIERTTTLRQELVPTRPAAGFTRTLLHCDIIGDPANYPQSWKDNGIAGTPLLVGENGENLIPDGTSKSYKASRKVKTLLRVLVSSNQGASWSISSNEANWKSALEGPTNSHVNSIISSQVVMVFYLTDASPLESAANAEVLGLGDVWAGNSNVSSTGALLTQWAIGKVPTNNVVDSAFGTYASLPLTQLPAIDVQTAPHRINTALREGYYAKHPSVPIYPSSGSPAAKALPYLTRLNGKLYLQMLYKEMRHNGTSWGDDAKFNVVDNDSTTTDLNAQTIRIGQKRLELPFFIADGE